MKFDTSLAITRSLTAAKGSCRTVLRRTLRIMNCEDETRIFSGNDTATNKREAEVMSKITAVRHPRPKLVHREEPEIEWSDYPRIEPGEYRAYCKAARWYFDPYYQRWTCLLRFDVLSPDLQRNVACVPFWMNGGNGKHPKAGRRSKFFHEWIGALGRPPAGSVRPSLGVFQGRMARVLIRDTKGPAPYSVVCRVLAWETG
jgi:hypothetical protein